MQATRERNHLPTEILLMITSYISSDRDIECLRLSCKSFYTRLSSTPLNLPSPLDIFTSRDPRYKPEQARLLERYKFLKLLRKPGNIFSNNNTDSKYILCYKCNAFRKPPAEPYPTVYITDNLNDVEQLCGKCILNLFFKDKYYLKKPLPQAADNHITVEMAVYRGVKYWVCDRCMLLSSVEEGDEWEIRIPYMHPHGCAQPASYKVRRWLCVYCHGNICYDADCGGWPQSWGTAGPLVRKSTKKKGKQRESAIVTGMVWEGDREDIRDGGMMQQQQKETGTEPEYEYIKVIRDQTEEDAEIHSAVCPCKDCKDSRMFFLSPFFSYFFPLA